MTWAQWGRGLFLAVLSGGLNAVVVAAVDMEHVWKVAGAAFALGAIKRGNRYLNETKNMWHPGSKDRRNP